MVTYLPEVSVPDVILFNMKILLYAILHHISHRASDNTEIRVLHFFLTPRILQSRIQKAQRGERFFQGQRLHIVGD